MNFRAAAAEVVAYLATNPTAKVQIITNRCGEAMHVRRYVYLSEAPRQGVDVSRAVISACKQDNYVRTDPNVREFRFV